MGELSARRRGRYHRHHKIQIYIQARKLIGEFSNWTLLHMRDIRILIPGFYTEFRADSIEQSGLSLGGILERNR